MKILDWIKSNNKIVSGVTIGGTFSIYFLLIAFNLISQERYAASAVFFVASALMISFIFLLFYNPKKREISSLAKKIKRDMKRKDGSLQTVFSTKNRLLVTYIEEALNEHGIKCFVFDEQANAMLSFIDGMEMRILIYKDDYEKSLDIVNEIIEQEQKGL